MDPRAQAPQAPRAGNLPAVDCPSDGPRSGASEAAGTLVGLGEALVRTVRHFWPQFLPWLDELPDTRFAPLITYDRRFLAWWGLALFLFKLGSRRQADFDLRDLQTHVLTNLNRLAGTRQETLPAEGTLDHFVGHLGAVPFRALADLRAKMMRRLIRMKVLDEERLLGHFVVAADGTGWLKFDRRHCDRCLTQTQGDTTVYLHLLLEAKLVGPTGLALSIGTEFIENEPGKTAVLSDDEQTKQDCELKALDRLAPALKHDFPQLPICLSSDSLYGCGRAIEIAEQNHWAYVFTFKEGRMPAVWDEFQRLLDLAPENRLINEPPNGVRQVYRWVNDLSYEDAAHRVHRFNALECLETKQGVTTRFAWMTSFPIRAGTVVAIATKGGRIRSKIENQGFNVQKNSDFNLEHPYSDHPEKLKAYYYFLQIAHIILQLLEKGSLLRRLGDATAQSVSRLFGSLRNIARRLLESFRYRLFSDAAFDTAAAARVQIRLGVT